MQMNRPILFSNICQKMVFVFHLGVHADKSTDSPGQDWGAPPRERTWNQRPGERTWDWGTLPERTHTCENITSRRTTYASGKNVNDELAAKYFSETLSGFEAGY